MPEKTPTDAAPRGEAPNAPARPGEAWTEEDKTRGATPGLPADAAGEAEPKGRPSSEREATEGAAAAEIRDVPAPPGPRRPPPQRG